MRHIFVVGLDDEHLAQLRTLPGAKDYAFHALFTHAQLKHADRFPVAELLCEGPEILRAFPDDVAAVIGYWDFPVSTVLPLLRAPLALPGPSLEAVLRCEHKYWSRICQREAVPEYVPAFCSVDPFAADPLSQVSLPMPFWLKPVKAVLSHLGYRIDSKADFDAAITRTRARIGRYAEPFNLILDHADLPPEVAGVDGHHCIAEEMISSGSQVTQEGWAHDGHVEIYGTIDSLRCGPTGSSFDRYQYPSRLPAEVLERMSAISERVIRHLGYTTAPFNIEYFWDPEADSIRLLEINARISKSHAPLFYMVDGTYQHQVMVELGMGQTPAFVQGRGECGLAAKFMVRRFADALVTRVPTAGEIARATAEVPHARVQIAVREGMRLSELRDQDSYSYEVAVVFIGAGSPDELEANYRTCLDALPLEFEEIS